jgi:lysine-arginine-ornithine-binding protein
VKQEWDGMIPALLARKFDAIAASMSITAERKKKVAFSDKYYQTPAKFVEKKGADIAIAPEGLKGKRIGVQRETIHDRYATDNYGKIATIVRYGTQDEANLDMQAGRLDLLLADSVALEDGFLKTPAGKDFEFVGPNLTNPKWFGEGVGIAMRKQDNDLREQFNKAIAAIRKDGTYDKIAAKYFTFDVYGSSS